MEVDKNINTSESAAKDIYLDLLENNTLPLNMSGEWEIDKKVFTEQYEIDQNIEANDLTVWDLEFDDEEDYY